ncbi:hypothetical protein F8S13_18130 [Chloroflexia bacterium SDU3-3]|nr:hypothetical protein F8S13_18130 [Chloroflexia bacterium SDU3-3]
MAQNPMGAALDVVGRLLERTQRAMPQATLATGGIGRAQLAEGAAVYTLALAAHARCCAYALTPALAQQLRAAATLQARAVGETPQAACRPSHASELLIRSVGPQQAQRGIEEMQRKLRRQLDKVDRNLVKLRAETAVLEELTALQTEYNEMIERWIDARLQQRAALRAMSNWVDTFVYNVQEVFHDQPDILRDLGLEGYEMGMLDRFCQVLDEDLTLFESYSDYMVDADAILLEKLADLDEEHESA